ncbi:MAG: hypothetical protein ABTQ32_38420 [Myxococcaceae bacterium]
MSALPHTNHEPPRKTAAIVVIVVVTLVASASWGVDAKACGDTVVGRAKALKVLGAGGEDMARAICHDLKEADRETFTTCTKNASNKAAIDACVRTAGRKAMGR